MSGMKFFTKVGDHRKGAKGAAFDISSTVLTALTSASQFAPLPFLQDASLLALAILNTVQGAKDNKEAFKSLANDACELVSAILCVYSDLEKDGQLTPSPHLKKRVEDLISLLQDINLFAQKHVQKGAMYHIIRLSSENQRIEQYRQRLRQALDVFGLQSSISIHENVVEILKELREREQSRPDSDSSPGPSSPSPASDNPFANLSRGNITGNITMNTIHGDQVLYSSNYRTTIVDSFNGRNFNSSEPWTPPQSY